MNSSHRNTWIRWAIVVVTLLLKSIVFDKLVGISWEILPQCAAAILIALPVVWTERKYIIWLVLGIVDLWLIANLMYYRANHLFLTWQVLTFATNLSGFESSILQYMDCSLFLPLTVSLLSLPCIFFDTIRFTWRECVFIILLCILFSFDGAIHRWLKYRNGAYSRLTWEWINPCIVHPRLSDHISQFERQPNHYIMHHSIMAYPLYMANDAGKTFLDRSEAPELTEEEMHELAKIVGPIVSPNVPQGNLVVILLESFESWIMDAKDANGDPVCPELCAYIEKHPVLYTRDLTTQIVYGMSGDGQMIVNTGLFPTLQGVACFDYGYNTYPNFAHFYEQSAIVNPCRNVWNQNVVTHSYGYQRLVEPESDETFAWTDSIVIDQMMGTISVLTKPCCVMGISISSHTPFDRVPDKLMLADTIPPLIRNYMCTAHYTDRQVGRFLAWADTSQVMQDAVIAITGDHRIFTAWQSEEIRDYGLRANLPFGTFQAGTPLILIAPGVTERKVVEQGAQVDVFPTILHSIGQGNYYWKGMGHNLWNEPTGTDDEIAIRKPLSDKLIRMNYFEQYEKQ